MSVLHKAEDASSLQSSLCPKVVLREESEYRTNIFSPHNLLPSNSLLFVVFYMVEWLVFEQLLYEHIGKVSVVLCMRKGQSQECSCNLEADISPVQLLYWLLMSLLVMMCFVLEDMNILREGSNKRI